MKGKKMTSNKTVLNTELKEVLTENLTNLNNATSHSAINKMFEAMKKDENHKDLKTFKADTFIKYCWNLADYSGEEKTPLGYEVKRRNNSFEKNVGIAVNLYHGFLNKGDDLNIEFKENVFLVPQKYIDNSKEAQKQPNKKVKLPITKITQAVQFAIDGTRKSRTPSVENTMTETVENACNMFAESILKRNLLENNLPNYKEIYDKFDDGIVKMLEQHRDFTSMLINIYNSSVKAYKESLGLGDAVEFIPESRVYSTQVQDFKKYTPSYLLEAKKAS